MYGINGLTFIFWFLSAWSICFRTERGNCK